MYLPVTVKLSRAKRICIETRNIDALRLLLQYSDEKVNELCSYGGGSSERDDYGWHIDKGLLDSINP